MTYAPSTAEKREDSPLDGGLAPDRDALLCALILAPDTYARNRFFQLFQAPEMAKVRRRARRVRSMIAQLTEPWPLRRHQDNEQTSPAPRAVVLAEELREDGMVVVRYRMIDIDFVRTTALEPLEAAALRYALARAGRGEVRDEDRHLVDAALSRLCDLSTHEAPGR